MSQSPKQTKNQHAIQAESMAFAGTCGESSMACTKRFMPAFINHETNDVEVARMANGHPAPVHLIAHLPATWAERQDGKGQVLALRACIEAGFVRDNRFYTREEASRSEEPSY